MIYILYTTVFVLVVSQYLVIYKLFFEKNKKEKIALSIQILIAVISVLIASFDDPIHEDIGGGILIVSTILFLIFINKKE